MIPTSIACLVVVSTLAQIGEAAPGLGSALVSSTALPLFSLRVRSHLLTTPSDAVQGRQLRLKDPNLTPFELAQNIPLSTDHHRLIDWMQTDLLKYHEKHNDVWAKRLELRPKLLTGDIIGRGVLQKPVRDRNQVRDALDLFADTVRPGLQHLTLADFYNLVSVFVTPDHDPKCKLRIECNVTEEGEYTKWGSLWPTEALVFTTAKLGFRRMAMTFGLHIHYVGLISHLDLNAAPHGFPMLPCEFLRHDLGHAIVTSNNTHGADWPAIHRAYELMRDAPGRTRSQRQMDDLAYFFWTHELRIGDIFSDFVPYAEKIAGTDDWKDMLDEANTRVKKFWKKYVRPDQDDD